VTCRECKCDVVDPVFLTQSNKPTTEPACRVCYEREIRRVFFSWEISGQEQRSPGTAKREYEQG
jgi:hypothetical protein